MKCCGSTAAIEERAAATVPASIGDASQAPVITSRFCSSGDGAFLGIERPDRARFRRCLPGPQHHAIRERVRSPGQITRPDKPTLSLSQPTCHPKGCKRVSATGEPTRPASRALMLRCVWHLNGGLQEKLDQQAIEGTDGLLTGTNLPNNNVSERFDIRAVPQRPTLWPCRWQISHAHLSDVKMIVGAGNIRSCEQHAFKGNNSDESGVERLQKKAAG